MEALAVDVDVLFHASAKLLKRSETAKIICRHFPPFPACPDSLFRPRRGEVAAPTKYSKETVCIEDVGFEEIDWEFDSLFPDNEVESPKADKSGNEYYDKIS
ncbi:MAG: hypothetical protein K2L27_03745 [Muribaculaceae bacterium]|nr:hypothetical protein [Muribaculaceae bacterium]